MLKGERTWKELSMNDQQNNIAILDRVLNFSMFIILHRRLVLRPQQQQ